MHTEALKILIEKSKTKKDGVYTFQGIHYKVVDKSLKYFSERDTIYNFVFGFLVEIGKSKTPKAALKTLS